MFTKTLFTSALVATVTAHQNFHELWVNDVSPGYQAGIRMPPSNSPVVRKHIRIMILQQD
jgi:cellulase